MNGSKADDAREWFYNDDSNDDEDDISNADDDDDEYLNNMVENISKQVRFSKTWTCLGE